MDRSPETAHRLAEQQFQAQRAEYAAELRGLLGARRAPEPVAERGRAAALAAEHAAGLEAAQEHEWGMVAREWSAADAGAMTDALHRLSGHLGARALWVVTAHREPQAVAMASDGALDNPLGLAAAGDHQLRLLDRELPAGLWLTRHSHQYGPDVIRFRWELEVWGEPWLSAATRALRGVEP